MADRKSLLSRFWPLPSSRRTSTRQTAAPPPATTTSTPSTKPSSQTSPSTAPPPRAAVRQSTAKATSPPAPATPPRTESRKDDQPNRESSPETSKSPSPSPQPKDETKISSPSRATTRSPPASKPVSPSRLPDQSRTPPQPSSPSHAAPQARSTLASPSRATPKRPSKPHSPSRVTSPSPKQGPSSSPSKESTTPTETLSTSSKENDPKPAASQQEPEMKEDVKTDSAEVIIGQTQEGKSFEHGIATTTPAQGNIKVDPSTVNGGDELDAKPEETKDVKEVMQARNNKANEETKKEVGDPVTPTRTIEKAEIPSEADQIHREKPDTKEILDKIHREKPEAIDTKEISATTAYDGKSAPTNGKRVPLHKNIRADMSKFANQMSMGDPKRAISDRPVSVITLAGENRGASMQMESDSSKREGPVHIHRSYKINPDDSPEATTDGEENSEGKNSEDERSTDDQLTEAYVNNNAQGINNSIVFNSSITEGSPGVHMVVTHLPKEPIQSKDKTSYSEARKAEVNTSHAEKLTYQPTVKRRCLRGLLLESSDSDPENPEKPRRHGCRVGGQKGDRENNIDVL